MKTFKQFNEEELITVSGIGRMKPSQAKKDLQLKLEDILKRLKRNDYKNVHFLLKNRGDLLSALAKALDDYHN